MASSAQYWTRQMALSLNQDILTEIGDWLAKWSHLSGVAGHRTDDRTQEGSPQTGSTTLPQRDFRYITLTQHAIHGWEPSGRKKSWPCQMLSPYDLKQPRILHARIQKGGTPLEKIWPLSWSQDERRGSIFDYQLGRKQRVFAPQLLVFLKAFYRESFRFLLVYCTHQ